MGRHNGSGRSRYALGAVSLAAALLGCDAHDLPGWDRARPTFTLANLSIHLPPGHTLDQRREAQAAVMVVATEITYRHGAVIWPRKIVFHNLSVIPGCRNTDRGSIRGNEVHVAAIDSDGCGAWLGPWLYRLLVRSFLGGDCWWSKGSVNWPAEFAEERRILSQLRATHCPP